MKSFIVYIVGFIFCVDFSIEMIKGVFILDQLLYRITVGTIGVVVALFSFLVLFRIIETTYTRIKDKYWREP